MKVSSIPVAHQKASGAISDFSCERVGRGFITA
jgi:hypothetical protein